MTSQIFERIGWVAHAQDDSSRFTKILAEPDDAAEEEVCQGGDAAAVCYVYSNRMCHYSIAL